MIMFKKSKSGFSLTEILVAITCVGVLAGLGSVSFLRVTERSKGTGAEQVLADVLKAQRAYYIQNNNTYANNISHLGASFSVPAGFDAPEIEASDCYPSITKTKGYKLSIDSAGAIYCEGENNSCEKAGFENAATSTPESISYGFQDKCEPTDDGDGDGTIGGHCFLAGTPISMADGTTKPIEELHAGDMVVSFNEETKQLETDKVLTFYEAQEKAYLLINDNIKVTPEHPFYLDGKWVKAKDLKIGSHLLTSELIRQEIVSLKKVYQVNRVYNIEVDRNHTFIASDIIVHNKRYACKINPDAEGCGGGSGSGSGIGWN